ncbi:MAG: hypothetical protein ACD_42C00094G0002 [uncultured bacterium]|nr:MAG: hypothetical protein ACD_42C00094G0002 [uncultured bacterium]OGT26574.1 MAG: hypothetical protein A3B71_02820 [Gammaproteobacteria bacterium RIFCSPHIGHO2_02_FULL_42_43]OGT52001.1 MAG: hypothetical protein A3E54_04325 [Gammaproteobacteria bacterium RIFCSPHIGHO2_12_FULL_41_25]OGT61106.1 MAG: hypothetical protein A3I77_06985 [Gammaproteobacteria bacterium RIFCSPLOWO2_02_FULL_42_14]OGT87034.1 MAG: hypothetical protein A3G86_00705 [Gammaproteobacteria bacterium RIFCSPLOWO2_12_FULL_42_18]
MRRIIAVLFGVFLITTAAISAPHEVIIIRHADKWDQSNPGPYLSPKGQLRAEKFVAYYLSHYQKPDFIFASNPAVSGDVAQGGFSYRPLQTVMPLANQLAYQNSSGYFVNAVFHNHQYAALAKTLLQDKQYRGKTILICWHHGLANDLAHALGVTEKLSKWKGKIFDRVYVLTYDDHGKLFTFRQLENQYPVSSNPTWENLASTRQG